METGQSGGLALENRPEAKAESVERLVERTLQGKIRIPSFQRGLRWLAQDVVHLFDSIRKGLPIGSLLLWKREAPAGEVSLGPLVLEAPAVYDAWWVVDGQQRLTAVAASLARPLPLSRFPEDPYVVYFDPERATFHSPPSDGHLVQTWVPLPELLDATRLSEFVISWPHRESRELRQTLFETGKRIREYQIPLYVIETDSHEVLQEIFFRVNKSGRSLKWSEIHDALYGEASTHPSKVSTLADRVREIAMGDLSEDALTTILVAMKGLDVTRTLAEHHRKDPELLRGAAGEALGVLRRVLSFLRFEASIPHLRLLPRTFLLEILARFFAVHPDPRPRSRTLLVRFLWRTLLSLGSFDERTLRRRAVNAISEDEESSLQALLGLLQERPDRGGSFVPPASFDARSARSRLALLALASLDPLDLRDGLPLDVAVCIERLKHQAFPRVFPSERAAANRLIHPPAKLRELLRGCDEEDPRLRSHAISPEAYRALEEGRSRDFVRHRSDTISATLVSLGDRLSGWSRGDRDRPSIEYLLAQGAE